MRAAKFSDAKIFGTSVLQVISAVAGKPLLDVPLHEDTFSLIEQSFHTHDLAKLGQLCGLLLQRISADPETRRRCLEFATAYKSSDKYAEYYAKLTTGLVLVTYGQTEALAPAQASTLITTYFLSLSFHQEALLAHAI